MHWLLVFIARGAGVVGLGLVVLVVATADDLGLIVALRWVLLRILLLVSILLVLLESLPNVLVRLVVAERRLTAELLGVRVRVGLILIVLISLFLTRIFRALGVLLGRIRLLLEGLVLVVLVLVLGHKLTLAIRLLGMPLTMRLVVTVVLREGIGHVCSVIRVGEARRLLWNALSHNLRRRLVEARSVELLFGRVRTIGRALLLLLLEDLGCGRHSQVRLFGRLLRLRWVLGALNLRRLLLAILLLLMLLDVG